LAVARAPEAGFARFEAALPAKPFLLLLEGLEKPGNLGAILRSADAAGVSGVIASECRTDLGNPNVVRASKGTLFTVPVVETDNKKAAAWLAARGIPVYAAAPEGALDYRVPDYRGPFAVALGAEREGLSGFWFAHAAGRLAIPMCGRVNSLNVAQAATLFSYEALRQRSGMIEERNHA
jgi:TrmH family RNA methyltransferase